MCQSIDRSQSPTDGPSGDEEESGPASKTDGPLEAGAGATARGRGGAASGRRRSSVDQPDGGKSDWMAAAFGSVGPRVSRSGEVSEWVGLVVWPRCGGSVGWTEQAFVLYALWHAPARTRTDVRTQRQTDRRTDRQAAISCRVCGSAQ